jgi:hypothetical protein
MTALQERFEPKSKKTWYQAELEACRTEGWADFAEDKAYPELQAEASSRSLPLTPRWRFA